MPAVTYLAVLLAAFAGALGVALWLTVPRRRPDPAPEPEWLNARVTRRVIVHTRDDRSFEGILEAVHPDGVVLAAARFLPDDGEPIDMAGRVYVPRDRVEAVQLP